MGPVMPPSKKPEVSGISVASASMSHLYQTGSLSRALQEAEELDLVLPVHLALPLAPLPGGAAKPEKGTATPGMEDEELTNLNWLHESKNLLNSFGDPVLRSVSPVGGEGGGPRNGDPDDTPPSPSMVGGDLPYDAQRNPNCKPPYSFSCLIFMAIEDAPSKRLPVKEIYNWILEHFPYFANAPTGWKNSVRHNLSLNKCFKKVDKDRSQSIGKGSLWCVDPEYRQNLIQALKKTPYHPHAQVFSTPPTSPQAYQRKKVCSALRWEKQNTQTRREEDQGCVWCCFACFLWLPWFVYVESLHSFYNYCFLDKYGWIKMDKNGFIF
uniref:Forkhead box protein N3 n=1 Tax=Oncorhynchus kisutch TaxID=8019 RepID=A0A8C7KK39_ONCKI